MFCWDLMQINVKYKKQKYIFYKIRFRTEISKVLLPFLLVHKICSNHFMYADDLMVFPL